MLFPGSGKQMITTVYVTGFVVAVVCLFACLFLFQKAFFVGGGGTESMEGVDEKMMVKTFRREDRYIKKICVWLLQKNSVLFMP